MIGLIQRVQAAQVEIDGELVGKISQGIVLLLGVQKKDNEALSDKLLHKVINYRIFEDDDGKMNNSLLDIEGELLVVSQFTLPANTKKGLRPSFASAAPPELGQSMYDYFVAQAGHKLVKPVQTGEFGADMQVSLINDGPVTFWLEV
ncbi:D-aminoacyl-tRNA deacylase [Leucothrix pacifica]|uniref:D-aminoacyl-tRNA deacylase n=1 Tax=Leucothrix pacifica TaxID=1247513 RepID=A0A317C9G6_9GAMM|nr:D-aminoacyl-tRNA deacylase [Leucothrix pacifica]PWQ93020.1 D-tyrosyl-tRNA(Tyr) deacylase [Leucothrix pacifica]